jgi:hypothetical protein
MDFTRTFRLNEVVAGACRDGSVVAAGPLMLLLVAAVGALGLLPPVLPLAPVSGATEWAAGGGADPGKPTNVDVHCCVREGRWLCHIAFHISTLEPLSSRQCGIVCSTPRLGHVGLLL